MKHKQHSKLSKPSRGFYGKNEISILGTTCDRIKALAFTIGNTFKDKMSIAYIDAEHASNSKEDDQHFPVSFSREAVDMITHQQFNYHSQVSDFEKNAFYNSAHLILVNGNHEKADHQIVFIDAKKEASLKKRKDALTNVIALIRVDSENLEIPSYIKELIPNQNELPIFSMNEEQAIGDFVLSFLENKTPKLQGLIFGGGQSTRMGVDKVSLDYHGIPQYQYLHNHLSPICEEVFVSCRQDQSTLFENPIADSFTGLGAYGGLLSAFQKDPNSAWLAVACDIPLLNKATLEKLKENRDPSKIATCFYNSTTGFPEPLITIWEPRAYPVLLHYLSLGYSCTRKVLINSDVKIVRLENEDVLLNANTSEDREKVKRLLSSETA